MTDDEIKKVLGLIRLVAPDLEAVTDATLRSLIAVYAPYVWKKRFGGFYHAALAFFIAHQAKLRELIAEYGSDGAAVVSGGVTSEHEGDLSRSYGSTSSSTDDDDELLSKTVYGLEYKRLKKMLLVPVMTRYAP